MKEWHEQAERYFRTRLESTDPDAAKEMLEEWAASISEGTGPRRKASPSTSGRIRSPRSSPTNRSSDTRRCSSSAKPTASTPSPRMSVSTIDDHLRLTPTQKTKIGEIVQASAADYLEDIQRYWGDYFERGMLMSLANAAEEDALKAILTEQQFDRLREATSNFDHFWDQKRRLKRAKEKASERRKNGEEEKEYEEKEAAAPAQGAGGV